MSKYKWAEGCRLNLDAQVVGSELERLRKKYKGDLSREIVVKEAENTKSPLHDAFEWDDTEAARQFRLVQAGYMVRHVVVVFEDPDEEAEREVRAFVSVQREYSEKPAYTSIQVAMDDPDLRNQVFQQAMDEINRWKKKYRYLKLFERVFDEIDALNEMIEQSRQKSRALKPIKRKH